MNTALALAPEPFFRVLLARDLEHLAPQRLFARDLPLVYSLSLGELRERFDRGERLYCWEEGPGMWCRLFRRP